MKDLGDRMKRYEEPFSQVLLPRTPAILRIDGRAFHTLTRKLKCKKPFDEFFIGRMVATAEAVCSEVQGFEFCYVASDEISILFHDLNKHTSEKWFGGEINKINSVAASIATLTFNKTLLIYINSIPLKDVTATFDCRVFSIPKEEVPNYFLWRQKDWNRNSLSMFASMFFSHKEMLNKHSSDLHEMLHAKGENWALLPQHHKNGVVISPYEKNFDYRGDCTQYKGFCIEWHVPIYNYYTLAQRFSFNRKEN